MEEHVGCCSAAVVNWSCGGSQGCSSTIIATQKHCLLILEMENNG